MERQDAIDACRGQIKQVLSQLPSATDESIREAADGIMEQFENGNRNGVEPQLDAGAAVDLTSEPS